MSWQEADRCQAADNNDEEQVVQSISVSVKKSCFDELKIDNLDELLEMIQEKQRERKHDVHVEKLDNTHHLKGCFCGVKAVREELQQILKEKMKEKQEQDEIRNKEKQLEDEQAMLTETNEVQRQNLSEIRPKTTPHFVLMDKDIYDYLIVNCHGDLQALCNSIKACETERGFEIEFNTENVEKLKYDISALQNRFVVREHKVSEDINYSKFKGAVTLMATQKQNDATTIFDSEQKTVKVIGSLKEADEIMHWILTLCESQRFDVKDEVVTKNAIETVNEQTYKHRDKGGATTEETKGDEKKTLIYDNRSECPDRKGTTKDDFMGDDNKTLTDDTNPQHPDKQGTTKGDNKGDKKVLICDTNSEQRHENIKANAETRGDDEKTLNDNTKSENPHKKGRNTDDTNEDDNKTSTDDSKSYPDKGGTSTDDTMGYDKKTQLDDTKSEHQAKKLITKDEVKEDDKNTLIDNSKSKYPDKKDTAKEDTKGDDDKPLTEDTRSKHQERKVTANDEARGDDKKTPIGDTKSEYPDIKGPTTSETYEDDQRTNNDSKSYPDKNITNKAETTGDDKRTLTDDTKSECPDKKVTTKDEAKDHSKNTPIDNTMSECQGKQDPTTDNTTGDDDKTLTDDTISEHPDKKGASKLNIKKINAKDTMVGHDSMGVGGEESNVKLDIGEKGKAADKDKEMSLEKAAITFSKTGKISEYDNKSHSQSLGAATTDNYTLQQPTKQRKLVHRISVDEDAYRYIQRFLQQKLEDIKALCNSVQELRDEASKFNLGYTLKYEVEDETVTRRFQMLIDQVKVEEYKVPEEINASDLESVVPASAKSEGTMIFVQSEKNSLKIVGRPDKVDKLKKHIAETVSEQLLSQKQLSKENTHTYYSEQPCKQQSGTKFYHHIPIDKNLYTYLSTHCQKEIEQASERCTSITASEKGSAFTIDFELQEKRDERFVKRIFEKLIGQFKSEECRVMKGIDIALLEAANTLKEVMIFPQEDKQLLKLIGPNAQVSKTKKWIENLISDTIQSEQPSKHKPHVTNPNAHSSPITNQPQSSRPSVSTSLQNSNPVHSPRKPSERFKIASATSDILAYESKRVKNKLTVRVHFANIIKEKSDVLVSYDDEWLQGCTGLALAMKEAAGPDVERELANISKNRGPLEVGQVVHTSSGKLWPSVKYLAHAVSAKGSQYHPEDPKTFEILYKTFLNCFNYTNNKICKNSISIPPIGLRNYGVQLVSAAFSQAVEEYDAIAETTNSIIPLRSIHFVVQDPNVVKEMIKSIKSMIE